MMRILIAFVLFSSCNFTLFEDYNDNPFDPNAKDTLMSKTTSKSKYKHVYKFDEGAEKFGYKFKTKVLNPMTGNYIIRYYDDEREAAKGADIDRIRLGKEPVNILKKK